MADQSERQDGRTPEELAAGTEEPEAATRARAEDDAATRARQDEAEAGLRAADRALDDGEARLRETRTELRQREQELERTGDLTREVAEGAANLQAQTAQIRKELAPDPSPSEPSRHPRPDRRE